MRQLYINAFHEASEQYRREVSAVAGGGVRLVNLNLDTGRPARAGEYSPADQAYAELLRRHAQDHFTRMPQALVDDMLDHFRDRNTALAFDEYAREREKTLSALNELESATQRGSQR